MRRAALVVLCLSACGGEPTPPTMANGSTVAPQKAIVASIAVATTPDPALKSLEAAVPAIRKPLVSRGTPPSHRSKPDYRAIGTEPFWAVSVRGDSLVLDRPDQPPRRYRVTRSDDGRAIRYSGDGFSMIVSEGPCGDGMSDAIWSDRVQVAFEDGTLKGCGGERGGGDGF